MKAKKLNSGSYRVQVVAGVGTDGKRIVKSFTAKTEWEAIRMAEDFKKTRKEITSNNITVRNACEFYIESRKNIIEKTTIRDYNYIVKYTFQTIMEIRLSSLQPMDIQRAINADSARLSPKSVKNAYGFLKSVLKMFSVDINLNNIVLPKLKKKEKNLPEFETIFNIVKGTPVELPCLLSAWLSLRIGEVIGLQFKDVDDEKRTIKVRRTIIRTDDGYEVRESCKTEKSTRELQLPTYLYDMIKAVPHESDEEFIVSMSRKAVYSRFKRLIEKHNINMTYHDLRSLNASIMLMLGVPDKYAMERGGWSTDSILKSVYQQTFTSERKRVDSVIDDYFNGIINSSVTENNAENIAV